MRQKLLLAGALFLAAGFLAGLFLVLNQGVQRSQTPVPSRAEEGWTQHENTDNIFSYMESTTCWAVKSQTADGKPLPARGGSWHQGQMRPGKAGCEAPWVKFTTVGSGVKFDQIKVGYGAWQYGAQVDVYVDGGKVLPQLDAFKQRAGKTILPSYWQSPDLSCAEHAAELKLVGGQGSKPYTFDFDYLDVRLCSGATIRYLVCQNNACALSNTATATDSACLNKNAGASCSGGGGGGEKCQGNKSAPAKCFDCKKDAADQSQVNILDFSCFTKYYGENVGKP